MAVGTAVVAIGAGAWSMVRRVRAAPQVTHLDQPTGRIGDALSVYGQHLPTVELAAIDRPSCSPGAAASACECACRNAPDGSVAVRARGGSATSAMFTVAHDARG